MFKKMWLALAFLLIFPVLLSNNAFSHGDNPSSCENRYDAAITSMTINNGTQTFDPISDWDLKFDAQIGAGYDVAFTLHTANTSSQNNTLPGTTWYHHYAFGFGSGVCVDDAGPGQDIPLALHVDAISGIPDGYTQNGVEWGSWPDTQARYNVVWHNATDPEPPAEEQPPQQNTTDPGPSGESPPADNDDPQADDDEPEEDEPAGTLTSPFILKDGTTVSGTDIEEQLPQESIDVLYINGTLASYHWNGVRMYILSGNWTMAINSTAVFDFDANFTMVRANGLDRQAHSLDNLTAVNASDLIFGNDTMALASELDRHYPNGTIAKVNATITLEKLNMIKIEVDGMKTPAYGVVDMVVRNVNGETQAMSRQFDMI